METNRIHFFLQRHCHPKKTSDLPKIKSSTEQATEKINKKKKEEKSDSDADQFKKKKTLEQATKNLTPPKWNYNSDKDDDPISEFGDLPTKFQKTFIPDLRRISSPSQIYFLKANKEMTKGVKPYVGNKYAPSIATAISCAFIIIPFLLVSLLFNRIAFRSRLLLDVVVVRSSFLAALKL